MIMLYKIDVSCAGKPLPGFFKCPEIFVDAADPSFVINAAIQIAKVLFDPENYTELKQVNGVASIDIMVHNERKVLFEDMNHFLKFVDYHLLIDIDHDGKPQIIKRENTLPYMED